MQDKSSFILYCDLIKVVEKLPDEMAGKLFKIILRYVNDIEVCVDDILLEIAFEPVKNQLKRDLKKWEYLKEKRSKAGKISAEKRRQKSTNSTSVKSVDDCSTLSTVNVNDNVNVNVNVNDINNVLLKKEPKEENNKNPIQNGFETKEEKKGDSKKTDFSKSDFKKTLLSLGVNLTHLDDWCKVREKHRAPFTVTALQALLTECKKNNFPVADAVRICAERSWRGFKFDWINNNSVKNGKQVTNYGHGTNKISGVSSIFTDDDRTEFS